MSFTIIGTVIVLGSFYEREVRRDEAKELNDTLEWAQSTVTTQKSIRDVQESINTLKEDIYRKENKNFMNGKLGFQAELYHQKLQNLSAVGRIQDSLNDAKYLFERLNEAQKKPLGASIRQVNSDMIECWDKELIESEAINKLISVQALVHPDLAESQRAADTYEHSIMPANICQGEMETKVDNLFRTVFKRAQLTASQSQKDYQRATLWSHFLIPLGLLLALIGKITGLGEVKTE